MEDVTDCISEKYPLHFLVWDDKYTELGEELQKIDADRERRDPRGRTPLMLAVTLGHTQSARVLIDHGCNVNADNSEGWSVAQEAIASGDAALAQLVLRERDVRRYSARATSLPALLQKLTEAPDFYVEMKWEFASWVPFVSRMCPHDTYRIYKQGSRVRIDSTLLGCDDGGGFERGNKSFIFHGKRDRVLVTEVDHEQRLVLSEEIQLASRDVLSMAVGADAESIQARLTTPIVTTYVDTTKIEFKWNQSGIWGFRSGQVEEVDGRPCKVFTANNVELVTKTRTEHLSEQGRESARAFVKTPLHSILATAETEERTTTPAPGQSESPEPTSTSTSATTGGGGADGGVTATEYFDRRCDLGQRDIGRPRLTHTKVQKLKATLWLCESYPLSLPEQALPIIDLMAIHSTHFMRLREFVQMQLPAGFPVKVEIPLFHVLTARVSFCNIFGLETPVAHVSVLEETPAAAAATVAPPATDADAPPPPPPRLTCVLEDAAFEPPPDYQRGSSAMRSFVAGVDDDELLQMAIQQSLLDQGTEDEQVDLYQALRAGSVSPYRGLPSADVDAQMLQRAIELSLGADAERPQPPAPGSGSGSGSEQAQLAAALELSRREQAEADRQSREEEEMLRRALQLSLVEQ